MKKLMFWIILFVSLVQAVFVIINVDTLLAEAVIPYRPAREAVIPYRPAREAVILFKPAPEMPSLKEHLIFFVRHLLEYQSPISIDIIFQESTTIFYTKTILNKNKKGEKSKCILIIFQKKKQ